MSWIAASRNGDLGTHAADRTRIVNMTLQFAGLRQWQNHVVSQAMPQHGLYLVNHELEAVGGCAFGDSVPECIDTVIGPPMVTSVIAVNKETNGRPHNLVSTVTHEIGHSVGLPHHGQRIEAWYLQSIARDIKRGDDGPIMVVAPGGDCVEPRGGVETDSDFNYFFLSGTFVGCSFRHIIVRNGEHSGNAECPMRYSGGQWRVAPGSAVRASVAYFDAEEHWSGARRQYDVDRPLHLYAGRFLKYDNSLDHDALGRFCLINKGTELNALPGDQNHAGDSQVACMDQLVVNDNVLRGIR